MLHKLQFTSEGEHFEAGKIIILVKLTHDDLPTCTHLRSAGCRRGGLTNWLPAFYETWLPWTIVCRTSDNELTYIYVIYVSYASCTILRYIFFWNILTRVRVTEWQNNLWTHLIWTEERQILYTTYSESSAEMILLRWVIRNYPLQEISFWKSLLKESEEGVFVKNPTSRAKYQRALYQLCSKQTRAVVSGFRKSDKS